MIRASTLLILLLPHTSQTWLGAVLLNLDDQADYLSQIEDIRERGFGMRNWYAPLPQTRFINPFYFVLGLFARFTQLPSVAIHEIGWFFSVALAIFLLSKVVRHLARGRSERALLLLSVFAGGLGWMGLILPSFQSHAAANHIPDLVTELYFVPSLFAAAHIPLSIALLPFSLLAVWETLMENKRARLAAIVAPPLLLLLHPYFVPLLGVFGLGTLFLTWRKYHSIRYGLLLSWLILALIALTPHMLMLVQNPYRRYLLVENHLALAQPLVFLLALMPWLLFILLRRRLSLPLVREESWIVLWMFAAVLTLLFPFAWKRKMIEAQGLALIWLAWPALLVGWQKWRKTTPLLFAVFLPIFFLSAKVVTISASPSSTPERWFVSRSVMQAWLWIRHQTSANAVVIADTNGLGIWTPVYARRESYLGHPYETPNFSRKQQTHRDIFLSSLPDAIPLLLEKIDAQVVLTSSKQTTARLQSALANTTWKDAAAFADTHVWVK